MEGFEGLITNEKLGWKSFSFRKNVDEEFQVPSHEIQSSFIHVPHFPQWKCEEAGTGNGNEEQSRERTKQSSFRVCPIFRLDCSPVSLALTLLEGNFPPFLPNIYGCCFSFSFSKPEFSLKNFSIFSSFARAELFFKALATNFLHFSLRSEQLVGLWAHDNHFRARILSKILTTLPFCLFILRFDRHFFFPFHTSQLIRWKMSKKTFPQLPHALALFLHLLDSLTLIKIFPIRKRKTFSFNKIILRCFCAIKSFACVC